MGVDSYWQVPDGLDYCWETELHHNREGHIIQPFTSLSITHLTPPPPHPHPLRSLQLWDTIRPVCYEGSEEQSRQGHDNKLSDGCGERKGHRQLDNLAIPISERVSAVCQVWAAVKGLKGCGDPHPATEWYKDHTTHSCEDR